MSFDCIILDFDGTFTDVEQEAVPFLAAYREEFSKLVGEDVTKSWEETYAFIAENPDGFGWEFDGRIVAPSHADPYIMATSTAQRLLNDRNMLPDDVDRRAALDAIFKANYPKAKSVFRPEAKRVVEELLSREAPVFVVTNSHTDAVEKKLDELAPRGRERLKVFGNAKKYVVTEATTASPEFDGLPESTELSGLKRPIYLRRGHYFDLLRNIQEETGATAIRTLVAGDIFELDLALPAALGYAIHLVTRPGTPRYEYDAAAAAPQGGASDNLGAVLERL